ncbi:MAG: 50S ribosomal protein L22 [Candidatus Woesearchaeota archaeon]
MTHKYAFNDYNKELMARAIGVSLSISTKQSVEVCNAVRGKPVARAKVILEDAINEVKAIPYRKFNKDIGHKPKIGPGRFPQKTCHAILNIINTAETNAQFKGLNTNGMIVRHICAHKASTPWHFGRQRGIKMKRTHIEVVLEETKKTESEKKQKRSVKKVIK